MTKIVAEAIPPKLQAGIVLTPFDASTLEPTYLAELPDGRRLQISYPLYQLLLLCDGKRSVSDIAQTLSHHLNGQIGVAEVAEFIERRLRPQGLLQEDKNSLVTANKRQASAQRSVLQLLIRIPLLPPRLLNPITAVTQHLYAKPVVIPILILIMLVHFLTYLQLPQVVPSFNMRGLTVTVYGPLFALVIFGSLWHELGHLSACRRFDCEHGELGCGLYVMWPVFYVDISAAWRLPRWQRIIIDLGGFYFQMVLTLILYTVALLTRQAILLFPVIIAMDMSMIYNLNPMFKFDGYWLLSDIIGVPNLHRRMGKYLKEMLPWPRKGKMSSLLRTQPYAKITACLYALFSAIYLVYFSWMLIWIGPKIVSEYPRAVVYLGQQAWDSLLAMDIIGVLGNLLSIVFSSIMPLVLCLMLIRLLTPLLKALRRAMPSLRLRSSQEEKTSSS